MNCANTIRQVRNDVWMETDTDLYKQDEPTIETDFIRGMRRVVLSQIHVVKLPVWSAMLEDLAR